MPSLGTKVRNELEQRLRAELDDIPAGERIQFLFDQLVTLRIQIVEVRERCDRMQKSNSECHTRITALEEILIEEVEKREAERAAAQKSEEVSHGG